MGFQKLLQQYLERRQHLRRRGDRRIASETAFSSFCATLFPGLVRLKPTSWKSMFWRCEHKVALPTHYMKR